MASSAGDDATLRKLFGGAMECLLPAAYVDVSDLRQVPDHQEVFASKEDGISIVIEVLSFEADINMDEQARKDGASARHFFDDLAAANGATSSACDFCGDLSDSIMPKLASYTKSALAGRQTVAKFRQDAPPDAVRLYLVNVRLPNVGTDLLITVNVPCPDQDTAVRTMAGAECFCSGPSRHTAGANEEISTGAPLIDANKTSETASGAHAAADGTAAGTDKPFKSAADFSPEATVDGVGGVDKPEGSGEIEAGVGEGKGEKHSSPGGGDDVDLGVAALRTLLQSFAILDWSLFG
ncbi:conserved unknown protein [Ectocarpus siliculosus]|uniref:Uncharacterized protein n=1 Tax=Ectocarpus siliculosus TaxID=2880 RepID=D7FJP5_ECTSI|nr:conserved unknown protein [Ectocarpus siliculosus]|eukprot:CBJ29147.1 conserved unknown protein [Ectocarpus siliculosus]